MVFYSVTKKKEILLLVSKWMEMENIIFSKVRHRRPKIICSPSYADYRPKTNSVMLLYMGHILREGSAQ
jgi:hypothetical protein